MNAHELTARLGGRWSGRYGCPANDDRKPSLAIRDGERAPLVRCYAGCPAETVIGEMRRMGLWPGRDRTAVDLAGLARRRQERDAAERAEAQGRTALERRIWQEVRPAAGTVVERYLAGRGITIPIPPTIRYAVLRRGLSDRRLPGRVREEQADQASRSDIKGAAERDMEAA